jgi:dTDP-glucose 4,6-dehydratase
MNQTQHAANGSTYVVIGSNSFTGSHFVDAILAEPSNYVVGISRSPENSSLFLPYKQRKSANFEFHQVDLVRESERLISVIDRARPRYIINLAALSEVEPSIQRPEEYFQTNCIGVIRLCNQLRSRSYLERYLHISTAEVYGDCPDPAKETTPSQPSTPYAASKASADLYLSTVWKKFQFPAVIIRSSNVYGKHQQLFKIIPRTMIYLNQGKKLQLHGRGQAVRSYLHVQDVVRGSMTAMYNGNPGDIYNLATEVYTSIRTLVQTICEYMSREFEELVVEVDDRKGGQDQYYVLDCSKARTELGWSPHIPLEEGLKEVIAWVEDNWDEIRGSPLEYIHKA